MVLVSDVLRWNPDGLNHAFDVLLRNEQILTTTVDDFVKTGQVKEKDWAGEAAQGAASAHKSLADRLDQLVTQVRTVRVGIGEAASDVMAVRHRLIFVGEDARRYQFQLADDGQIIDHRTVCLADDPLPEERERIRVELSDRVRRLLQDAKEIDFRLTKLLHDAVLITGIQPESLNGPNPVWDKVLAYMISEMVNNSKSDAVKQIRNALNFLYLGSAATAWMILVKTGGPWDHKGKLRDMMGGSFYTSIPGTDEQLNYDFWSNLHYGYVGRAAGFTEDTLINGAQAYTHLDPKNHWGPSKEAAIRAGAQLWEQHPNPDDLLKDPGTIMKVIQNHAEIFRNKTPDEPAYLIPS